MMRFAPARMLQRFSRPLAPNTRRWAAAGLDLVFPPSCALCDVDLPTSAVGLLCEPCRMELLHKGEACRRCAMPATGDLASSDGCPWCRGERFYFDEAFALGRYEGLVRQAALRMKRSSGRALALAVAEYLAAQFAARWQAARFDAVVPVPMHWSRRVWRGANSPDALCEPIGRSLGLPVAAHVLARSKRTQPQANLSPGRRRRNLRGAFRATQHADLPGARLLLIDDIMTTGATVNEAAKTLKRAGASFVAVAVVARAEGLV